MSAQTAPSTSRTTRADRTPWIVAAVLAVLCAVLVLLLVQVHSASADSSDRGGGLLRPTTDQQHAVDAAATEAANLTTLSRANYAHDFARALAGVTGSLKTDLLKHKTAYLSAMQAGKFDLRATVVKSAFASESDGKVIALVTLNGSHVVTNVASPVTTPQRLQLTMQKSGGRWLAADFTAVGVQ